MNKQFNSIPSDGTGAEQSDVAQVTMSSQPIGNTTVSGSCLSQEEADKINEYMRKPFVLSYTAEEIERVKRNLNCKWCEEAFAKSFCKNKRHTKESRCGKCQAIAKQLKETKILTPQLF